MYDPRSTRIVYSEETNGVNSTFTCFHRWRRLLEISLCGPLATVDLGSTQVLGDLVKVLAWYDNEMGYATRLYELAKFVAAKSPTQS